MNVYWFPFQCCDSNIISKAAYRRKRLFRDYSYNGGKNPSQYKGSWPQPGMVVGTAKCSHPQSKATNESGLQRARGSGNQKALAQSHTSSIAAILPKFAQTVPPTGDQYWNPQDCRDISFPATAECVVWGVYAVVCMCGGQRIHLWGFFFSSTISEFQGLYSGCPAWVSIFMCWAISLLEAVYFFFKALICLFYVGEYLPAC